MVLPVFNMLFLAFRALLASEGPLRAPPQLIDCEALIVGAEDRLGRLHQRLEEPSEAIFTPILDESNGNFLQTSPFRDGLYGIFMLFSMYFHVFPFKSQLSERLR